MCSSSEAQPESLLVMPYSSSDSLLAESSFLIEEVVFQGPPKGQMFKVVMPQYTRCGEYVGSCPGLGICFYGINTVSSLLFIPLVLKFSIISYIFVTLINTKFEEKNIIIFFNHSNKTFLGFLQEGGIVG